MIQKICGKAAHLKSYTSLAYSPADWWPLLRLAWRRFDVYKPARRADAEAGHWSARLKCLHGLKVHLQPDDLNHLAIFDELFLQTGYDLPGFHSFLTLSWM